MSCIDEIRAILVELAESAGSDVRCCRLLRRPRRGYTNSSADHVHRHYTPLKRLANAVTEARARVRCLSGGWDDEEAERSLAMLTLQRCADEAHRADGQIAAGCVDDACEHERAVRAEIAAALRQHLATIDTRDARRDKDGARTRTVGRRP